MNEPRNFGLMSAAALKQRIDEKRDFLLLDTLPQAHFERLRLPGARNACVYEVTFVDQVRKIETNPETEIVIYASSDRSMGAEVAAAKLHRAGYRRLRVLEGGLAAWRNAGFPAEGQASDLPDDPQTLLELAPGTYQVDPERSSIEWTGRNPNSTHVGHLRIGAGSLTIEKAAAVGSFEIDMNSITNVNLQGDPLQPVLISHLKSDDFFWVSVFPSARFEITGFRLFERPYLTAPNCEVSGRLTLRGVSAEQSFAATLSRTADGGLAAESHFDIDRTRWSVIYGSARFFEHLGMHVVFDTISVQVRIYAS